MIMCVLLATLFLRIIWVSSFAVLQGGRLSLSIPVRKIISSPQGVEASLQFQSGRPCSLCLLVPIKQMRACQIALLRFSPSSEWILKCYKRKAQEHLLYRTQKMSCLLNPFPISGEKSVYTWTENGRISKMKVGWVGGNLLGFLDFLDSLQFATVTTVFWGNLHPLFQHRHLM